MSPLKPLVLCSFLLLGLTFSQALCQINITQPAAESVVTACTNYTLSYLPTASGFSTYVVVEVHQNNSLGPVVKTYTNVSGQMYLAQGYPNIVSSSGLPPGNYQIKIYDYYNPSFYGWSEIFTISPLNAPSLPTVSYMSGTTFSVWWPSVNGVTEYRADVSTTADFQNILPAYNNRYVYPSESSGFYISGLNSGSTYYVRLRSVNSCSISQNSPTISVTTCSPPSNAPLATGVTAVTATSFQANWNGLAGITNYILVVTRAGHSPVNYQVNGTSFIVSPVNPSSNYTYKVKAVKCGLSPESNVISLTTLPLGVPVFGSGGGDSDERWTRWSSVPGAKYYHFQVSEESDFSPIWDEIETTKTSYTFTAYFCSDYYMRVRAKSETGGYSAFSAVEHWPAGAGCRMAIKSSVALEENLELFTFPNPVNSFLNISLPVGIDTNLAELRVWNSLGHEILLPFERLAGSYKVDASTIPAGFYILTINQGPLKLHTKFIKR